MLSKTFIIPKRILPLFVCLAVSISKARPVLAAPESPQAILNLSQFYQQLEQLNYPVEVLKQRVSKRSWQLLQDVIRSGVKVAVIGGGIYLAMNMESHLNDENESSEDSSLGSPMHVMALYGPLLAGCMTNSLQEFGTKMTLLVAPQMLGSGSQKFMDLSSRYEAKKPFLTKEMQSFCEKLLSRYGYFVDRFSDPIKEIENALEEILLLPTEPKELEEQMPELRDLVTGYDEDLRGPIAEFIGSVISQSKNKNPSRKIQPIFLEGPPGTGKTFLVREIAEIMGLPFKKVDLSNYQNIAGNSFWSSDPEKGPFLDAMLSSSETLPANIIIFFDEIDKCFEKDSLGNYLNSNTPQLLQFLHSILERKTIEHSFSRYCGATHKIPHIIIALASNKSVEDIFGTNAASMKRRLRTIRFDKGFDFDRKLEIANKFIEEFKQDNKSLITDENLIDEDVIEEIIKQDEEERYEGVGILLEVVESYLLQLFNQESYEYYTGTGNEAFDINKAYAGYRNKTEAKQATSRTTWLPW